MWCACLGVVGGTTLIDGGAVPGVVGCGRGAVVGVELPTELGVVFDGVVWGVVGCAP